MCILYAVERGLAVAGTAARVTEEEDSPAIIQKEEVLLGWHQLAVAVRVARQNGSLQCSLLLAAQALEVQPLGVWREDAETLSLAGGQGAIHTHLPWQWQTHI